MVKSVTPEKVKEYLDYLPDSGRLVRVKRVTSGKLGEPIGNVEFSPNSSRPYRRAHFHGKAFQTAHLVWAWHHGVWPEGRLIRKNDDSLDDRIENLAQAKDLRRPVKVAHDLSSEDQPDTMLGDLPESLNTGIYEIRNVKNGRRYIGSAVNVSKRWREHLRQLEDGNHHSQFMQRCWNKNGEESFIFRVILACDKENLIMYEQAFLDFHQPEYNSAKLAGSQLGYRHSDESRKKMSKSRKGKPSPRKGVKLSDETKLKISINRKGKGGSGWTQERRDKISAATKGRVITEEQRAKISSALKGRSTGRGKLTEDQVLDIRSLAKIGMRQCDIAKEIGIHRSFVHHVVSGSAYRWVE